MEEKIDEFKQIVKDAKAAYKTFRDKKKTTWVKIANSNPKTKHISLYETTESKGNYLLRCEAILPDIDPEKLLKLNTDNNFDTRKQWETGELLDIEQLETFPDHNMNIIRYHINIPVPGVYDREFLGLQYWEYNKKHETYTLIFKTVNYDEKYPCDTSLYVAGSCMTIMKIRKYGGVGQFVSIFTYVTPNGWIPDIIIPLWKEKLRVRMRLYETVLNTTFDEIYKEWVCQKCSAIFKNKPDGNKCRRCGVKNAEMVEL